jgi:hypothetical protein
MKLKELLESQNIDEKKFETLIQVVIDLNLSVPTNISNELNGKLNKVEKALKDIGISSRDKNWRLK